MVPRMGIGAARLWQVAMLLLLVHSMPVLAQQAEPEQLTRIAFGSCIRQDRPLPILQTVIARQPDLFLFLGDNIYADTHDMEVMRAKYRLLAADAGFSRLRRSCAVMATWDDHDYGVNDGGADYPQRDASQQVFLDFWQEPATSARRRRAGIYDARVFGPVGRRVQVIMLDTRYFRGPLTTGARRVGGPYVPGSDRSVTLLGEAQWEWLAAQLAEPAEVRLLVSSIQCVAEAAGQETWANLPHERERLFELIRRTGAQGVVVLSGDRHWAELSVAEQDAGYPIYDLTSSSLNQLHPRGTPTENPRRALPTTYHAENFGEVEIDWDPPDPQLTLRILDQNGVEQLVKTLALSELR